MRRLRSGRAYTSLGPITLALTFLVALVVGASGTANAAADPFRFWGFYQWSGGSWTMAQKGPAQVTPKDGAVDGWRYAISAESGKPRPPRAKGDFEQICGSTPKQDGKKRVAVVIDFGVAGEAPSGNSPPKPQGECAVVAPKDTSAQVIAAVATVRDQKGLVCALDKFPTSGCGDAVKDPPAVKLPEKNVALELPAGTRDGGGLPIWGVAVGAIVVIIVLGGFLTKRQQSKKQQS